MVKNKRFSFLFVILVLLILTPLNTSAQSHTSLTTQALFTTGDQTPFWLQSNRHGIFSPNGNQWISRFQSHQLRNLSSKMTLTAGADLVARPGLNSVIYFNQGYIKLNGYGFELSAGRFHNSSPINDPELSMGSLGVSHNAIPIPQIRLGLADWTSIPFTNDFIELKGHIAHGWLGSRRYINDVLLHEKVAHLRFGGDASLKPYIGIAHYVKWGGTNPNGREIPTRFSDFINVFFALGGDEQTPGPDQTYALGNHLGALDLGFFLNYNDYDIVVYRQFPFELLTNVLLKSYMDALTGFSVTFPENVTWVDRFLYEFLYTKFQAGPRERRDNREPDDRGDYRYNENYYNHYFYRTGWAYNFRSIGNPLFTLNEDNLGFFNNRILAHHIAFTSTIQSISLTGRATYSRNYGKRCDNRIPDLGENEVFGIECANVVDTFGGRRIDQLSIQIGTEVPIPIAGRENLIILSEMALDSGKIAGSQIGILFGFRWDF